MGKMILTAGRKIMIYSDPLTRKIEEGEATLIERWHRPEGSTRPDEIDVWHGYAVEKWQVRFVGDPEEKLYVRDIWTKPIDKGD